MLLEAMAWAMPIVATDVMAIPEIVIPGETGLLISPNDVDALAQAICSMLEKPEWAKKLGENGRRRLEKFFTIVEIQMIG